MWTPGGNGQTAGGSGGSMGAWGIAIPAAISLLGMMFGGKIGSSGNAQQMMTPEMREMLRMQMQRMRGQEPLYNDVMGMARGLLPTRYRNAPSMGTRTRRERSGADGMAGPGAGGPGMQTGWDPMDPNDPSIGRDGRPGGKF